MRQDRNILIGALFITVLGYFWNPDAELFPLALICLSFLVFFVERILIGRTLSFLDMTIPSFFLLGFVFILVLPVMFLWDAVENPARDLYLSSLLATLNVFPLGVLAANCIGSETYFSANLDKSQGLAPNKIDAKFEPYFWSLLFLILVILIGFIFYSSRIQLLSLLAGTAGEVDAMEMRFTQTELPRAMQYFFELARRVGLPLCMLYAYFMKSLYGAKWRRIFQVTFWGTLFVSLLTLDRSPPLAIFAMLGTAYFIVNKKLGNLRWLVVLGLVGVALLLAGVVSIFQYQSESISLVQTLETAWYVATVRVFQSPYIMATRAFQSYNYDTNFLYGESVRLFSLLPGFDYAQSMGIGEAYSVAPVTFVGDLWRNWGWPGVVLGAMSFGFVFQVLQAVIFKVRTAGSSAIYVLILWGSLAMLHGNALGVVTLSVILLGAALGFFVRNIGKQKRLERISLPSDMGTFDHAMQPQDVSGGQR